MLFIEHSKVPKREKNPKKEKKNVLIMKNENNQQIECAICMNNDTLEEIYLPIMNTTQFSS